MNIDYYINNGLYHELYNLLMENCDIVYQMPKEGSSIDKKYNFVDNFCKNVFPNGNLFSARKKYRLLIKNKMDSIGNNNKMIIEKKYDNLIVNDIILKKYYHILNEVDGFIFVNKVGLYLQDKIDLLDIAINLNNKYYPHVMRHIYSTNKSSLRKKYIKQLNMNYKTNLFENKFTLYIDLNQYIYDKFLHIVYFLILLTDNPIYINGIPMCENNLDAIAHINNYISINYNKINKLEHPVIIFTSKQHKIKTDNDIYYWIIDECNFGRLIKMKTFVNYFKYIIMFIIALFISLICLLNKL